MPAQQLIQGKSLQESKGISMSHFFSRLGRGVFTALCLVLAFFTFRRYFGPQEAKIIIKDYTPRTISTLYGEFHVTEPVLLELFDSPAMERIKKIQQFGVYFFLEKDGKPAPYSRYTHSVGVWALLRKFKAPLEEQMAGLLHDASHTIFSQVGDYLFDGYRTSKDSYQDDIHRWYLEKQEIGTILAKYGYSLDQVLHKNKGFKALEQRLPDVCADRLEYNLFEGVIEGMLTKNDVKTIVDDISFEDGKWFFKTASVAEKFARVPLHLTAHHWGSPSNFLLYSWTARALRRAIDIELITWDDVHFSTDDVVWKRLKASNDGVIQDAMMKMGKHKVLFKLTDPDSCDYLVKVKFRGVNPLIKQKNGFKRLTEVDKTFADKFEKVRNQLNHGWPVKLIGEASGDAQNIRLVFA